ncbi:MAG TPA: diaminopimelate epimerase, partial [Bacteroidales bacterium]|nr:diaminopimelate epimerase [Bacteroidales bacterium]
AFAKSLGIIKNETNFHAIDGEHKAIIKPDGSISLKMMDVLMVSKANEGYFLNTGSPHFVCFKENIEEINVYNRGKEIRYSQEFMPEGTNVNFVEIFEKEIFVRTYERGVENETLSCGTGVTASAICTSIHTNSDKNSYQVKTLGGILKVEFTKEDNKKYTNIWLSGPATYVFEGETHI